MLLRAALVILVMLNLSAAAWWAVGPRPRAATPPPMHAPQLQLLEEARSATPHAATTPPATGTAAPHAATGLCLRFGPFAGPSARNGARDALLAIGVEAVAFEDRSGASSGWDVFLPAQPSRADAVELAGKLKAQGIDDVFVMNSGDQANRIALGRFSSEAGAHRRAEELRGKGIEAMVEARGSGAPRIWLNARLPTGMGQARVAQIAPSKALDCKLMQ